MPRPATADAGWQARPTAQDSKFQRTSDVLCLQHQEDQDPHEDYYSVRRLDWVLAGIKSTHLLMLLLANHCTSAVVVPP